MSEDLLRRLEEILDAYGQAWWSAEECQSSEKTIDARNRALAEILAEIAVLVVEATAVR